MPSLNKKSNYVNLRLIFVVHQKEDSPIEWKWLISLTRRNMSLHYFSFTFSFVRYGRVFHSISNKVHWRLRLVHWYYWVILTIWSFKMGFWDINVLFKDNNQLFIKSSDYGKSTLFPIVWLTCFMINMCNDINSYLRRSKSSNWNFQTNNYLWAMTLK